MALLRRYCLVAAACCAVGTAALLILGVQGDGPLDEPTGLPAPLEIWVRWDSGWYQSIAKDGYFYSPTGQSSVAFFPLYPLLVRAVAGVVPSIPVAGILVSLLAGFAAVWLFFQWAKTVGGERGAEQASWTLLLWPFAFFLFGVFYSDALFLSLAIAAFWSVEKERPWRAALFGALATATRPIAPALVLGLAARQLERRLRSGQRLRAVDFVPVLAAAGAGAYVVYLWLRFGDPLAFMATQAGWGQMTGPESWLKLPFLRSVTHPKHLYLPLFHFGLGVTLAAMAIPLRRALGWGYALYVAAVMGMPFISSKDFIGIGRYGLAAFPAIWMLSQLLARRPSLHRAWLTLSALGLLAMTVSFAVGRYTS